MNIFILDANFELAAQNHCDKHVIKMIVESAQLLSTAHHVLDPNNKLDIYKKTHENHPCAIWVRESNENYRWLLNLAIYLCKEYTERYNKEHKTFQLLMNDLWNVPINGQENGLTIPPKCMPDNCKIEGNTWESVILSYRNYYRIEKINFATWKKNKPNWF